MGIRFRKSIKIAPGVKVNVGKKSVGVSVGGKYGGVSVNSKSGTRVRTSVPGTGVSYTQKVGGTAKKDAYKNDSDFVAYMKSLPQGEVCKYLCMAECTVKIIEMRYYKGGAVRRLL